MTSGRPRRLLGPTVGSAAVLAVLALIVWGVALWASWGGSCPNAAKAGGGLDKGISVWPPAAQCANPHGGTFWHQALPWAPWLIGALIAAAAIILVTGLIVAIRDLRRPTRASPGPALPVLATSPPYGRPPDGHRPPRHEVDRDEPDRRAMAA